MSARAIIETQLEAIKSERKYHADAIAHLDAEVAAHEAALAELTAAEE